MSDLNPYERIQIRKLYRNPHEGGNLDLISLPAVHEGVELKGVRLVDAYSTPEKTAQFSKPVIEAAATAYYQHYITLNELPQLIFTGMGEVVPALLLQTYLFNKYKIDIATTNPIVMIKDDKWQFESNINGKIPNGGFWFEDILETGETQKQTGLYLKSKGVDLNRVKTTFLTVKPNSNVYQDEIILLPQTWVFAGLGLNSSGPVSKIKYTREERAEIAVSERQAGIFVISANLNVKDSKNALFTNGMKDCYVSFNRANSVFSGHPKLDQIFEGMVEAEMTKDPIGRHNIIKELFRLNLVKEG